MYHKILVFFFFFFFSSHLKMETPFLAGRLDMANRR